MSPTLAADHAPAVEPLTPARSGRTLRLVACLPLAAAALGPLLPFLIVFTGVLPPSAPHPSRSVAAGVAIIIGVALLVSLAALAVHPPRLFPRRLVWPLAALGAAQAVAGALSVVPMAGLFGLLTFAADVVCLVAACETLGEDRIRRAFLALYFSSAMAASVFAIVLAVMKQPPAMFAYEHGRASGTFLQPNEFAGYLLFVIPLGIAQLGARGWLRGLGLTAALVGMAGLVMSVSRAALGALALALILLVARFGRRAALAYATLALVCLVLLATAFRDVAHDPSENASRLAVWGATVRIAQRFALTGIGPLAFPAVYPAFRLPSSSANEVHAHDLPLQILVEDGIAGLAALTWLVVAAIAEARRRAAAVSRADRERYLLLWALAAGFTAAGLQSTIDVVTTVLLAAVWPLLGLALALGSTRQPTMPEAEA